MNDSFDAAGNHATHAHGFGKGVVKGGVKPISSAFEETVGLVKAGYALAINPDVRDEAYEAVKRTVDSVAGYVGEATDHQSTIVRDVKDKVLEALTAAGERRVNATSEQLGGGANRDIVGSLLIPAANSGKPITLEDQVADIGGSIDGIEDAPPDSVQHCPNRQSEKSKKKYKRKKGEGKNSNTTVETQTVGGNTATWTLDENNRPIRVKAKLSDLAGSSARSYSEIKDQASIAKEGIEGDEGGHLIGHRFMGDQGSKNMFPQNANFNKGAYKKLENEWADWIDLGYEVNVEIELCVPKGGGRPSSMQVQFEVVYPKTGERQNFPVRHFKNMAGEKYERVHRSDM